MRIQLPCKTCLTASTKKAIMLTKSFTYDLPEELIAYHPSVSRSQSRLLSLDKVSGKIQHLNFTSLKDILKPNDLLVFNDSKVMAARLFGQKASGGKIELLVERLFDDGQALCHIRANKAPKPGSELSLGQSKHKVLIKDKDLITGLYSLQLADSAEQANQLLADEGEVPLPPYIKRKPTEEDVARYQTVYAKHLGSVAAPTAGLHFDDKLMAELAQKGVKFGWVTLHVGAGTFKPVSAEQVKDHVMHSEYLEVSEALVQQCHETKEAGGRVIAVGTTSVRCLETAASHGTLSPYQGETKLFITPGYQFNVVDSLITNFHLSGSTLLMLVSALGGHQAVMQAYQAAIAEKYRFFSYGDAMLIHTDNRGVCEV